MKTYLLLLLAFFGLTLCAQEQQNAFINQPHIETAAEADSLVTPDRIHITVVLKESDFRGKKSVEEQEQLLRQALKNIGVNTQKDLTLLDFGSDYERYFLRGKDIIKTKTFDILVRNATMTNNVLVKLEEVGISNVVITSVSYSKLKQLLLHLKGRAVAQAKQQAEALVTSLNQKVGKALKIVDNIDPRYASANPDYGSIVLRGVSSNIYGNRADPNAFQTDFKNIRYKANVQVVFALD